MEVGGNSDVENSWTICAPPTDREDESLTVVLDAVPVDGRLHIRDFKERDEA